MDQNVVAPAEESAQPAQQPLEVDYATLARVAAAVVASAQGESPQEMATAITRAYQGCTRLH